MEIDAPSTTSADAEAAVSSAPAVDKSIKIHPLAIIGISDHHTRVSMGGSALPPSAPVVGLLFGNQDGTTVSIIDTEEMEYPDKGSDSSSHRQNILTKIELYRKVFPKRVVVGWYRVHTQDSNSSSSEMTDSAMDIVPTDDDLRMNQEEMTQYCGAAVDSPLFVLMNAVSPQYTGIASDEKPSASTDDTLDDTLPLSVYETLASEGGSAFVNATFELETHEPERIAVEWVFQQQPTNPTGSATAQHKEKKAPTFSPKNEKRGGDSKKEKKEFQPTYTRGPSELEAQLDSLQSSIRSLNARMSVLLEFLKKVESGELPPDNALLRSIDGLLQQLPLVLAALNEGSAVKPVVELENNYTDTMLLSYLAAVAKTAKSVHVYSEKCRGVSESGKSDSRRAIF